MEQSGERPRRLVVVPNDPIAIYEQAGYESLERYFNPGGLFREVIALSHLEEGERTAFNMTIRGVRARDFRRALSELRPDVVRAYGGKWSADLVCANRVKGVPAVVSLHDDRKEAIHPSVRYADMVISMSRAVKDRAIEVGVDPMRIRILPNRVNTAVFRPIDDQPLLQRVASQFPAGKHILHVGRKVRQKNLDTLIRALQFLPSDYFGVFVGMGDANPYTALAQTLGVGDRCFWIEAVKNSELPAWYTWCDCFCVPSRWEGFGIVFIEAAACGTPIVTSDIAPMNEYLKHGASAFLLRNYEDPEMLADAIRTTCEDSPFRQKLSTGAIAMAQMFDQEIVDAAEANIYREVMAYPPASLRRRWEIARWRAGRTLLSYGRRSRRTLARASLHRWLHRRIAEPPQRGTRTG